MSAIIGLLFGLIVGFLLANSFSRHSFDSDNQKPGQASPVIRSNPNPITELPASSEKLSKTEIQTALEQAASRNSEPLIQKKIGLALYNYARIENDTTYLAELRDLLQNASKNLGEKDFDLLMVLGEICLETGDFEQSEKYFRQALKLKAGDVDAQNRLGTVYLKQKTDSAKVKAVGIFENVLKQNPGNEEALQNLINALIESKKMEEAEQLLNRLKKVNSDNPAIPDLEIQISQSKQK